MSESMNIFLTVVSLLIVSGISAIWPVLAWKEYKHEKARAESYLTKPVQEDA